MLWFEPGQLLIFLVAASILAVTPGPGVTYVLARTVAGDGEGVASSFGTAVGGLVHVVAAALGLSAILARSAIAFSLVKYIGACYLVYLGIRVLLSASGSTRAVLLLGRAGARRAFLEGIVTEVLNVKTALFFVAFVPQFVNPVAPAMGQFVLLGLVCVLLNTSVDVIVAVGASRLLAGGGGRRFAHGRWLTMGSGCSSASARMWRSQQASALTKRQCSSQRQNERARVNSSLLSDSRADVRPMDWEGSRA